jgi:hypothetical protein
MKSEVSDDWPFKLASSHCGWRLTKPRRPVPTATKESGKMENEIKNRIPKKSNAKYRKISADLALYALQGIVLGLTTAVGARIVNGVNLAKVARESDSGQNVIAFGSKKVGTA